VLPLVGLGQRRLRWRRPLVVSLSFLLVVALIVGAVGLFGARVADQAAGLGAELPRLLDPATVAQRLSLPPVLEPFRDRLAATLRAEMLQLGQPNLPAAQRIGARVLTAAGNLIYLIVVPVLSYLMVLGAPTLQARLERLGDVRGASFWPGLARDLNQLLAHYVAALALLSLVAVLVYGGVLSLLGVPFALLLAGAAATLEVIPVFGPLIGALAILGVALFSGYPHVWWLLAFLMAYRVFQDYVLNPWLMSEGVEVPALLVVFGLLAGDELAGVAGIFLSVPLIAAVRIVVTRLGAREPERAAPADGRERTPPPEP
jgi:predicted PurR-regulated permease PerM